MRRYQSLGDLPLGAQRRVVAIGTFDGVHLGHQAVIRRAIELAAERHLPAMALTFEPQPIVLGIPSTGRFACWRDTDERPWVAWTDANLPVLALARASSAGYSRDLLDWWQNSAGPGHPPNA